MPYVFHPKYKETQYFIVAQEEDDVLCLLMKAEHSDFLECFVCEDDLALSDCSVLTQEAVEDHIMRHLDLYVKKYVISEALHRSAEQFASWIKTPTLAKSFFRKVEAL